MSSTTCVWNWVLQCIRGVARSFNVVQVCFTFLTPSNFVLTRHHSTEMWVTIIIPSIPPLWPVFRQAWQSMTGKAYTPRDSQIPSKSMQLRDFSQAQTFGTQHRAHAGGSARDVFQHLGSGYGMGSQEAMITAMPADGILMTRDVSVSPHDEDVEDFPKVARPSVTSKKYGF